jgi:GT2 family glycosyltransferase
MDAGYSIWYCPDLVAYHKILQIQNARRGNRWNYYHTRNAIWYYWKYYPIRMAFVISACSIPYNLVHALRHGCLWSSLKGVLTALLGMPRVLRKRMPVKEETWRKAATPVVKRFLRI